MGKIIGIINQKGGVGKTTTANALGHGLAIKGKKVLLIDFDPQGSLSKNNRVLKDNEPNINKFILYKENTRENIEKIKENLYIISSNFNLDRINTELSGKPLRENYLKKAIEKIKKEYDYIIIDSNPSFSLLTLNVLFASDEILIPVKPEYDSILGLNYLIDTINEIEEMGIKIKINGILPVMVDSRRNSSKEILETLSKIALDNKTKLYKSTVRLSTVIADYPSKSTNIYDYKSNANAVIDYSNFVNEFIGVKTKCKDTLH